jgi:hypothetical protein
LWVLRDLKDLVGGTLLPSSGGVGVPPATSECRLDGGVQMRINVWFVGAGLKPAPRRGAACRALLIYPRPLRERAG